MALRPFDHLLATQAYARAAERYFDTLPKPDPQYTVAKTAEILGLEDEATVRQYMRLSTEQPTHPRRLGFVETTGYARGRRIPLSEIEAFQRRNHCDAAAKEVAQRRPATRRLAA